MLPAIFLFIPSILNSKSQNSDRQKPSQKSSQIFGGVIPKSEDGEFF